MKASRLNLIFTPFIALLTIISIYCGDTNSQRQNTTTTVNNRSDAKDTCVGPDVNIKCCFVGMPEQLTNILNIADKDEPGQRIIIKGTIYKEDGTSVFPGVIIYSYQTDNDGYYSKKGNEKGIRKWHGHLYGWVKTDEEGRYEIHSIRPGQYPDGGMPAHIHSAIMEPGKDEPYYINDFVFNDDKYVDDSYLSSLSLKGGSGVVDLKKNGDDLWIGQRDIILK